MSDKWDLRFLMVAKEVASWSKDPSTKCGAILVSPSRHIAATGFNGFPKLIKDTDELLNNREEKYKRVVHCELNALIQAKQDISGFTLYTWPDMSCSRCAVHMIQAGITRAVFPLFDGKQVMSERWKDDMIIAKELFAEAGLALEGIEINV